MKQRELHITELIDDLKLDPRFAGLDVPAELHRGQLWGCGGRTPTRRKALKWLAKAKIRLDRQKQ